MDATTNGASRNMLLRAKDSIWHVQQTKADPAQYLVAKGEMTIASWFYDYPTALEYASSLNIMEGLHLEPEVQQALIERAEVLEHTRLRSASMVRRYSSHPAFNPDNNSEDIFAKLARIIEYEMRSK